MDGNKLLEEKLRECASLGDQDGIGEYLNQGADVNSQNHMNGWTALHWASKRGYPSLTRLLIERGADTSMTTHKGELAVHLTDNEEVRTLLGGNSETVDMHVKAEPLAITPGYLKNPPFPYGRSSSTRTSDRRGMSNGLQAHHTAPDSEDELVLKVRVAESAERDYIEIELPRDALTFENLVELCCEELQVEPSAIVKIRKVPNTIVRKDKDVRRLQDFQELELVTKKKPPFGASPYTVPVQNLLY